jgi:hypothetical protein
MPDQHPCSMAMTGWMPVGQPASIPTLLRSRHLRRL